MSARYVQAVPFYPAPSPARYKSPYPQSVDALRKFAQGAGSALLVFSGADSMSNSASVAADGTLPAIDFSSVEGMLQTVMNGQFSGPFQIVAAGLLFLMAGRCVSRFLGLAVAAVVVLLYMQGVTVDDTLLFFERFGERLVAAAQAFQTAEVG